MRTLILIYVLSAVLQYLHTKISHSKKGIYSIVKTDSLDVAIVFIPLVNTITVIIGWLFYFPIKKTKNRNKFFNIK